MHVFIAYPFTKLIDENTGEIRYCERLFLEKLRLYIKENGHTVFLAHYRENWGKQLMSANECTPADLYEMKKADLVIAFPGEKIPSGGVMIELGWASILNKKIVLFCDKQTEYSPLVYGLGTICDVIQVKYNDEPNIDTVIQIIGKEI